MQLSPIVSKLRDANISDFENRIAGVAELNVAIEEQTLLFEQAFVLLIGENASDNKVDYGIDQIITERFAVTVALRNDSTQKDKIGLIAFDRLNSIRGKLFKAILGWLITDAYDRVTYAGARIIRMNRGWLWYQYEFYAKFKITDEDGIDVKADQLPNLDTIRTEYEIPPSENLPYTGGLPVQGFTPDMTTHIDLTVILDAGGFTNGFSDGFDVDGLIL